MSSTYATASSLLDGHYDLAVIGGGFYGCYLAARYAQAGRRVLLLEAAADLLTRASYVNQARIHNGYHYPRSLLTGMRSCINLPRFTEEFGEAVERGFDKLYAIASGHSKVSASQFVRFCHSIGAPVSPAPKRWSQLFDSDLIEAVFQVQEYAFHAGMLRQILQRRLVAARVTVLCQHEVQRITPDPQGLRLQLAQGHAVAGQVLLCAYSQINTLLQRSELPLIGLKHELAEVALVCPPDAIAGAGITVMDGAYFSTMPFPARVCHSLTHVRYTPHVSWTDGEACRGQHAAYLRQKPHSNFRYMLCDAQRYLPVLQGMRHIDSLFEVKTVLQQNETDDGRPILLRRDHGLPGLFVVMGGKLDNIYDIAAALGLESQAAAPLLAAS